jgi:flagellar assembly protein FliH
MLCNVYRENEVEVREAPWRRKKPSQPVPLRSVQAGARPSADIAQVQNKLEEMTSLMEQRAKDAWEQGRLAGDTAARKSLDDRVRTAMEGLAATVGEVSATRSETIRRAEADTVRLAIEIARRVLHRELSLDTSALEALIKAAISKLQGQEIYRVRVHPDQEKLMRDCLEQQGRGSAVEVVSDAAQSKGGVSFEISRGTLDASVDTQLREIENGLVDQMRRRA